MTIFNDFIKLSEDFMRQGQLYTAFILLYITMETQLRKLLTFILRKDPHLIHWIHIKRYIGENDKTNIDFWIKLFNRFHRPNFSELLSQKLPGGKGEYGRIKDIIGQSKKLRNKLFHGVFIYQENLKDIKVNECNKIMLE